MKKSSVLISLLLCLGILLSLTACTGGGNEDETTTGYSYVPQGAEGTTSSASDTPGSVLAVDNSWQKNFSAEYEYYNPEQSLATMPLRLNTLTPIQFFTTRLTATIRTTTCLLTIRRSRSIPCLKTSPLPLFQVCL